MGLTLNSVKIQLHRDIKLHKAAGDQEKFSEAIIVRNLYFTLNIILILISHLVIFWDLIFDLNL